MGFREATLALTIVVAALSIVPTAPAEGAYCVLPWGVASSAPAQDDARAGLDAGDVSSQAIPLPGHDEYPAWLDPIRRDGGDGEDWYSLDLPATNEPATFSVSRDYDPTGVGYYAEIDFRLDIFEPGATEPTYTTTSQEDGIDRALDLAGEWLLRVTVIDPAQPAYVCGTGAPALRGLGQPGATAEAVKNYIVYFGCDPLCSWSAA